MSVLLAIVLLATPVGAVSAGLLPPHTEVQARDDWFLPFIASVPRGGTVVWTFTAAARSHTATDSSGMSLFDSGIVQPGGPSFSYRFTAAGRYPYTCTVHTLKMNGSVEVPVRVWPETARVGRAVHVRWAIAVAPEGYVYDVQIERPGGSWSIWVEGATVARASFEPEDEGRFRFRARLRALSGGATGWSRRATLLAT